MAHLNAGAARAMLASGAHAATDVTGFGLLGHLEEMLAASGVGAGIEAGAVPLLPGAAGLAAGGVAPGGTLRNLEHASSCTDFGNASGPMRLLLADAQTSGGFLISVAEEAVAGLVAGLEAGGAHRWP